ncbi:MAG: dipeptide epimerase [Verrucomicrobia bacterium]|jgi:L-alanine-DL-glutamate epimerase-like enolase superfamily enzyme|nr:dipeptide epimerase [Verrucomicrobiota bacterium]
MQLRHQPYTLQLRHAFGIASNTRTSTPATLVEIEHEGVVGHGEAAMPPYLGETQATAAAFLDSAAGWLAKVENPFLREEILPAIDQLAAGNTAAKAAIDIALHDWIGRKLGAPWHRIWGLDPRKAPVTSYTIGIDTPEVVRAKTREAAGYRILKVKLGREAAADRALIDAIRDVTDTPITVDANQGWRARDDALRMIEWLAGRGVVFIEQPMGKEQLDDTAWLRERSPLPLIADESVQRLADVARVRGVFDGINIKLMKCTGLREAWQMITLARALGLKVMLGCMTETSCAISAAAQLSPLVDWADLDGAVLIANDCFDGMRIVDGRITLPDRPGIGVVKR